jgi:UDP-N-acetylmuramoyl-tripeptide--D-alanyl-D-alanine ligase
LKLETVAKYIGADIASFRPALLPVEVNHFVIDSREVQAGSVFFALSQPDYKNNCFNDEFADSHKFVPSAFEKGAEVCIVRPDRFEEHRAILEPFKDRLLFVNDAILALQHLAGGVYREWKKPVVAVTGSAGKTTAKSLIADVLSSKYNILTNIKNYNNGLGHPLTVLRLLTEGHFDAAVLEMGMSTPMNEIARLCRITPPDLSVVLNVFPVHVEHLGSIENVAKAKAEIVEGMKDDGTAVLNADDHHVLAMRHLSKGNTLTYGIRNQADVMAENIRFERFGETEFTLVLHGKKVEVFFPLNGHHNILNALSAASVGFDFGMSPEEIAEALGNVQTPAQRGEVLQFKDGFTIINDSYNSNPDALLSMVKTLVEGGQRATRKVLVAGEMRELGAHAPGIHLETGRKIAEIGIDALFGVEGLAEDLIQGAREKGLENVRFYENSQVAAENLVHEIRPGDLILVKGSRGVRTEKIIEKILERHELRSAEKVSTKQI